MFNKRQKTVAGLVCILIFTIILIYRSGGSKDFIDYKSFVEYLKRYDIKMEDINAHVNEKHWKKTVQEEKASKDGYCPLIPPNLGERISYDLTEHSLAKTMNDFKKYDIKSGGLHSPKNCKASYKVAIIIPYRNRETNMKIFMRHMHPFLIKQQIEYGIFLIEPLQNLTFNRGLLMNVGYVEALKQHSNKWQCFVFHDIDLLPEDERNLYTCPERPRHMSHAVSTLGYKLPYETIFGGVSSLTKEQMKFVNGYSNLYFGWGAEDDDFRLRIVKSGYEIVRYPIEVGRYKMIQHKRGNQISFINNIKIDF